MTDRESIEAALQRVQSGELSPADATKLLLDAPSDVQAGESAGESLASLIGRLGTPPPDIVQAWRDRMTGIAVEYERRRGEPLPTVDLNFWSVTPQGDLLFQGERFDGDQTTEQPSAESLANIGEFHVALAPDQPTDQPTDRVSDATAAVELPSNTRRADGPSESSESESESVPKAGRRLPPVVRTGLFAAGILACVAGAGVVLFNATQGSTELAQQDPKSAAPPPTFSPDVATQDVATQDDVLSGQPDAPETLESLETMESLSEEELSSIEAAVAEKQDSFLLDDLMPPAADFLPSGDADGEPTDSPDPAPALSEELAMGSGSSDTVDELLDEDQAAPDESPQQTRTRQTLAVALPSLDQGEAVTLSASKLTPVGLEFPVDMPLEFGGEQSPWKITDTRKSLVIATLTGEADGTRFRWSDQAGQSASATALVHGKIVTDDSSKIFLRPTIEADPWLFRVDRPDVMPTWDLVHPIPPRVTRLSVEFDLPDSVEQAWIEPIDPESLRRGRGLAVLTPRDGETVSLGLRFDFRCSRKLSCRVRYAGRLDPSMPWQIVSVPLLTQFAEQLSQQATLVSNEAARLSRVYEIAGSSGRRILRIKQQRNDERGEMIREASERVATLQGLIATLEAEGKLKLRIWVQWPDGHQQDLLAMESE